MKVHSIKDSISKFTFRYEVIELGKKVKESFEFLPLELESSAIDLVAYTSINFVRRLLSTVNILNIQSENLNIYLDVSYYGTDSIYTISNKINLTEFLKNSGWYSLETSSDERYENLKELLGTMFENLYTELETNFSTDYGIYFPPNHQKPILNKCVNCGKGFDAGSIFENFVQQGKDGVEFYQKHPNEILINTEDSYGEPYRFSSVMYVKKYVDNYTRKIRYYECTPCGTKQTYIEKV